MTEAATKMCLACRVEKPVGAFNANRRGRAGLQAYCKPCASDRGKQRRFRRSQIAIETPPSKRCLECGFEKPAADFYPSLNRYDGLTAYCKACTAAAVRRSYDRRKAAPKPSVTEKTCVTCKATLPRARFNKEAAKKDGLQVECKSCRASRVRRDKYGITQDEYDRILNEQGKRCACCGGPGGKKGLAVDHNHTTGRRRGMLCSNCNTAIGLLGESLERVHAVLLYLTKHSN